MSKEHKCEHGKVVGQCEECGKKVQIVGATKDGAGLEIECESIFDVMNFLATNPAVQQAVKESNEKNKNEKK